MAVLFQRRVFRFVDEHGAAQISKFPDSDPALPEKLAAALQRIRDKVVRELHFTEIENFTFLGYVLAHEIAEENLGDELLDVGIEWEHSVADNGDLLVSGDPLKVSDPILQAFIDDLDERSEALVDEINLRSRQFNTEHFGQHGQKGPH